jgi:uncharacterized protein
MACRTRLKTSAAALIAGIAIASAPASAQAPAGLPIWMIEDSDSTLYLTGTIHALPPGLEWRTEKLAAALTSATDVWFEIENVAPSPELMQQMMGDMMSSGPPLSSRLTADEMKLLEKAVAHAKLPPAALKSFERLKPWAVSFMLTIGPLLTGGLKVEEGIDVVLSAEAKSQGDKIHGLETIEDQMKLMTAGTEEEQLEALRQFLVAPEASLALQSSSEKQKPAILAWAKGDVTAMEKFEAWMRTEMPPEAYAAVLTDRNTNWAGKIETILAGKGVAFIAVGAAHVVGPNSVQEILALRGITSKRYQ